VSTRTPQRERKKEMGENVLDCWRLVQAATSWADENGWSKPRRFEAYRMAWQRAYDLSGAPYSRATPRLICLTSRMADMLS
jgi:hypothetical protein